MLRVSVIILVIMLAYGGLYSLMNVFTPKAVAAGAFKAITGNDLDNVQDAGYVKALLGSHRYMGVYALATTIAGFFILFAAFQKGQKWAWWSFLIVGGIMWLWGLVNSIIISDVGNLIGNAIGMLLFLIGILIPIKAFFAEASE